jgi:hypothetical protein
MRVGLALGFAWVCGENVWQWQVPKAWARVFMVAVRWVNRFSFSWNSSKVVINVILVISFFVWLERPMSGMSTGIVANVCVSSVVRFRSRVLSQTPNVERRYKLWATPHRTIEETFC